MSLKDKKAYFGNFLHKIKKEIYLVGKFPMSKKLSNHVHEKGGQWMELKLNDVQMKDFQKVFKAGIYRELYRQKMLTENQLNHLLNHI